MEKIKLLGVFCRKGDKNDPNTIDLGNQNDNDGTIANLQN